MSLTECLALDVECVGRYRGSQAARVSMVNEYGQRVMDTYVAPIYRITDYRTPVSGIRSHNLVNAPKFRDVREEVRAMIKGRILVGHSLQNDLKVLRLSHPDFNKRDTSSYPPFLEMNRNRTPKLRWLARNIINKSIQNGEHSSLEDATAVMEIYKRVERDWEDWLDQDDESSEEEYSEEEEEDDEDDDEEEEESYYSSSSSDY